MLVAVCGWEAYSWSAPQYETHSVTVPLPQAVSSVSIASQSGLFFTGETAGNVYQAPLLKTDVQFAVSGMMIRATVRQHFYNPSSQWLEGIYVFPLPERSGVDRLRMQIGDRMVEGQIREKAEAKKIYEEGKKQGKRASLVSSARDNLFTTRVANVGPEEEIIIEIQYADTVRYSDHVYSLRFPMVVAPRYVSGQVVINKESEVLTTEAPDAGEILSPLHDPRQGSINPLTLRVDLNPGFEAERIHSLYHPITVQLTSGHQRQVGLAESTVPANRDFVLEWHPSADAGPTVNVMAEQIGSDTYLHGTLFPPGQDYTTATTRPHDLTVVVDVSGSMAGTSLTQVKQSLYTLFTRLTPEYRFNLITFASETTQLFPHVQSATESNMDNARRFVQKLEANGGTELLPALQLALGDNDDDLRIQQVVVLTDGAIGNEEQVLNTIHQQLGAQRLFMVGMGSAPNSHLMREAAMHGRGTFTYIGDVRETNARMVTLLKKLKDPAVTNLEVEWPLHVTAGRSHRDLESYPSPIPDLYRGEPITFVVRLPDLYATQLTGILRIRGQQGIMPWKQEILLQGTSSTPGVAKLWAREKVVRLMSDAWRGRLTQDEAKQQMVSVALAHQLVTKHTSLVAVGQTVARPPGAQLVSRHLETNLPTGWKFEPVKKNGLVPLWLVQRQGQLPDQVMPVVLGPTLVALSLPQTATAAQLQLIIGFMGLCFCFAVYYLRRQQERKHDAVDKRPV